MSTKNYLKKLIFLKQKFRLTNHAYLFYALHFFLMLNQKMSDLFDFSFDETAFSFESVQKQNHFEYSTCF